MIFVTVGAQMPFDRLIEAVDTWVATRKPDTRILAQVGEGGEYVATHMECRPFLTPTEFAQVMRECRLVVGHAGMGTIINALQFGKPILVMPRLSYRQILWMPPESGGLLFFAVGELYAGDDVLNQCVAAQSSPAFLGCLAQLEHHRQTRAA